MHADIIRVKRALVKLKDNETINIYSLPPKLKKPHFNYQFIIKIENNKTNNANNFKE